MAAAENDNAWDLFLAEHAEDIQTSITENLVKNAHLFDTNDGSHAGWYNDELGVLIVLTEDEVEALASEDWRIEEGFANHPSNREYFGRLIQDLAIRALEAKGPY